METSNAGCAPGRAGHSIGTDHYGDDTFTLTRQSYATPYGKLPTVQPVVDQALVDVIGEDAAFAGELRHQGEHSLELVATWLHHIRGGQAVEVVPILVGSLRSAGGDDHDPSTSKKVAGVLDVLRGLVKISARWWLLRAI